MSKHTPGPWFAINDGTDDEPMMFVKAARISGQPPRHCVAICCTGDSVQEMENANAALIAAAPDMYEALRTLRDELNEMKYGKPFAGRPHAIMDAADAAIAKAEGRS